MSWNETGAERFNKLLCMSYLGPNQAHIRKSGSFSGSCDLAGSEAMRNGIRQVDREWNGSRWKTSGTVIHGIEEIGL